VKGKVTLKGATPQKVWGKLISGRLHVDLHSEGNKLSSDYNDHLTKVTDRLSNLVSRKVEKDVGTHYNQGISDIQDYLKEGVDGFRDGYSLATTGSMKVGTKNISTGSWKALTKPYYDHKPKKTKNKFWRNSGTLSGRFGAFAGTHKGAVTNKHAKAIYQPKGRQYYNKQYRVNITFELPVPHVGGGYFKELLQYSFFEGKAYKGLGYGLTGDLRRLGYLEGKPRIKPSKHRPFIAMLMASRGRAFRKEVEKAIKTQAI